jgi:gamma-glutamylcyclotransferase (GGCT)/AIG2-like uncharacterized protein YtfP
MLDSVSSAEWKVAAADNISLEVLPGFQHSYLFFYGSLMDTEVLQTILGLPSLPIVEEGRISGFKIKMWGIYPTLIPSDDGQVVGTIWTVDDLHHFKRLIECETKAYTWRICDIYRQDGEVISGGRTFCWAGDPKSKELEEGSFDLYRYQKYFKSSTVRRGPDQR